MIRAVLFDLGNVLVPVDFSRCHQALAGFCSHPPEDVPRIVGRSGLARKYESGQITTEDFVQQTCDLLSMTLSPEQFWEIWSLIFLPEPLVPESFIESLRPRHKVLLLSNTNAMHFELAKRQYPLLRHFDDYVLSYEVGAMKPSEAIYHEAIARAGCRPEECFFTDDLPANVEAARQQRMEAVVFQSFKQLREDLRALGVE